MSLKKEQIFIAQNMTWEQCINHVKKDFSIEFFIFDNTVYSAFNGDTGCFDYGLANKKSVEKINAILYNT